MKCLICNEIITTRGAKKYCSLKCRNESYKGKTFRLGIKHTENAKKIMSARKRGKPLTHGGSFKKGQIPWNKGKSIPPSEETKKKLSRIFKGRKVTWVPKGELSHRWKGGHSRGYKTGYYSTEYIKWRKAVFERDKYQCTECLAKGYITAHHIKSFAYFPELRFDLNNGITLCEPCHSKTDNYKGRNRNLILVNK